MKKENLILVHSFPTNSILLKGFIGYIDDYFNVYPIDLPGFRKDIKPLQKITIDSYSKFVEEKVKKLNLDDFLIGGISFGFIVVNNAKIDKKCKGIIAIEPYVNSKSLRMSWIKKLASLFIINIIISFKLYHLMWNKKIFLSLGMFNDKPKKVVDIIFDHINGKTFFETAKLILENKKDCKFQKLPYILLINKKDDKIKFDYLSKIFVNEIEKVLIIKESMPHYPKHITEHYFKTKFPEKYIEEIKKFVSIKHL